MSKAVSSELTFVEHAGGCGCRPTPSQPEQSASTPGAAVSSGYETVDKSGRCGCCSSYYRSVWDRLCQQLFGYIPAGMDTEQILRGLVIWKDDVVLVDETIPATFRVTATGERKPLVTDIIYYKEHFYNIGGVTAGASDVYTCTECLPIEASVIEVYKTLVATNARLEANEIVRRDRANQDHDRADADHDIASADHQQYGDDHFTAGQDHAGYEADHDRAASDHLAASGDRSRAADDHAVAGADHSTAQADHARADADHDYIESIDFSEFVKKTTTDLVNYYTKSQTYTKAEVQALIAAIPGFTYEPVPVLPTASADTMWKLYLVPSQDPQAQNVKDEFVTVDNGDSANPRYTWEQIGSTAIDLSGYVTTEQLNAALATYATKTDVLSMSSQEIENAVDAAWDNVMNA